MDTIYLLPCSCGRKMPVNPRQAGESITCTCGASLEVPTLLNLRILQRAELPPQPEIHKKAWGAGQRLIFLGVIVILFAIAIGGWLFWIRPTDPYAYLSQEQIKQSVPALTPIETWRLWLLLEKGGLERHKRGSEIFFASQRAQYLIYGELLAILSGVGLTLIAAGIIVIRFNKKKHRPARSAN